MTDPELARGRAGGYPATEHRVLTVSIGICAYNEEARIASLLESLETQTVPAGFAFLETLVVASGCTDDTESIVREWCERDRRIELVSEPRRTGKVSAINLILSRYHGDLLVFLNADARLPPGSLERLLRPFREDFGVDIACGAPLPDVPGAGVTRLVHEFLWGLHNRTLQELSSRGMPNHCCDEFMAIRRGFVESLPWNLINDGAYFGVLASIRGQSVHFCHDAEVVVEAPRDLAGLLQQRRRILRGHQQVRTLLDAPPSTLERLLRGHPEIVVRVLLRELRRRRLGILVLFLVAFPLELVANFLVAADKVRRRAYNAAWPTVGGFS